MEHMNITRDGLGMRAKTSNTIHGETESELVTLFDVIKQGTADDCEDTEKETSTV